MEGQRRRTCKQAVLLGVVAVSLWACFDYRLWRRQGPGGLPFNAMGWLTTTVYRLVALNPYSVSSLRKLCGGPGDISSLTNLWPRPGHRPRTNPHPVPRRQQNQQSEEEIAKALQTLFLSVVDEHKSFLEWKESHYELHHQAITLTSSVLSDPLQGGSYGEVAHVHVRDGSMHMVLSPSDAASTILREWGELHGLAGKVLELPQTYVLVYAPRDRSDLASVEMILRASIAYMGQYRLPRPSGEDSS